MEYLWSKFQQIRVIFGGERDKKHAKRVDFMAAASPWKYLKIYNFGTTNAILMKFTRIMYHHKTFHLEKDWGVNHRAYDGVVKKPLKKSQKISFLASFLGIFRTISKTVSHIILCFALHHWSKFQKQSDSIWGSYIQKTIHKQPKIYFCGPTKTFENS